MRPLPFVWPFTLLFWVVFLWAFLPEFRIVRRARKSVQHGSSPDAGSFRVIMVGMWLAYAAAFPLAWIRPLQVPGGAHAVVFGMGVLMLVSGSLLRRHCWRMLGASFTGDVQTHPDQVVVTAGAYRLLRHPSYTAGILMNVGLGMALGSWGSTVLLLAASLTVYQYRMAIEERALLATIGEPYREFLRARKRLIPYIY